MSFQGNRNSYVITENDLHNRNNSGLTLTQFPQALCSGQRGKLSPRISRLQRSWITYAGVDEFVLCIIEKQNYRTIFSRNSRQVFNFRIIFNPEYMSSSSKILAWRSYLHTILLSMT